MNGKQAKKLRRIALGLAAALDEQGRKIDKDGYFVRVHKKRVSSSESEDTVVAVQQIQLKKDSLKGIYKGLKNGAKKSIA